MKSHTLQYTGMALLLAVLLPFGSCSNKNTDKNAREEYSRSIDDSIRAAKQEIDSCNHAIDILRQQQDTWMRDFATVDNPREAAPYIIFNSFRNAYPPTSTGLIARLAENGQFELIASLKGGRFNSITVTADMNSATSDVVPADQALNYYADGLNTVLFTGSKADSIGRLIADNDLNIVKVTYLDGKPMGEWQMPNDYRKMVMATFELYDAQRQINTLERRVPLLNRKINLLREHQDKQQPNDSLSNQ